MTPCSISDDQTERAVARLTEAVLSRVPCPPVRDLIAQEEDAAYAVQRAGIARRVADGASVVGPIRRVSPGAAVTASVTGLGTVSCTFTKEKS